MYLKSILLWSPIRGKEPRQVKLQWTSCQSQCTEPGKPFWRGRLSTIDLLVFTGLNQLILLMETFFFTKQATLIRRSTVLSLSLKLLFSGLTKPDKTQLSSVKKIVEMRLCHPPDGSSSPEYKLLCFITTKQICKEKNALAFNWDRCCQPRALFTVDSIPLKWFVSKTSSLQHFKSQYFVFKVKFCKYCAARVKPRVPESHSSRGVRNQRSIKKSPKNVSIHLKEHHDIRSNNTRHNDTDSACCIN
jgi:hypothetical protein